MVAHTMQLLVLVVYILIIVYLYLDIAVANNVAITGSSRARYTPKDYRCLYLE